jgi:tRNA(Ile)-lysidine synthase
VAFSTARLSATLAAIDPEWRDGGACVAFSGGLDSSVLLHATAVIARGQDFRLRALHVDHGLQPDSGAWAESCRAACRAAGVPLGEISLDLRPPEGASIEAAAREARYAALAGALGDGERLVTAHHRDDQLETVLIQLLRGAGVAGLAAMPARAPLGRGWLLRPLLDVDRAELLAYATEHRLAWHEDPMNASLRFDRGWLRSRVLPALRERWPAASATVARSAAHLADASRLLADLAAMDAAALLDDGRLRLDGLATLSHERRANLVRWWLAEEGLRPPPTARLHAALDDFLTARADGAPLLRWTGGEIRRYRGRLYALPPLADGCGSFTLVAGSEGGLVAGSGHAYSIRFRAGGESLRPHPGRPRKRLKDLCQEAGIVPWMRDRLPLVFAGPRLVAVGDLWIDVDFAATPGAPALKPTWAGRPRLY